MLAYIKSGKTDVNKHDRYTTDGGECLSVGDMSTCGNAKK